MCLCFVEKGSDLESGSGSDEDDDSESGEDDIERKSELIDKRRERDHKAAADDLQTNIQTNIQDESDEFTLPTKQVSFLFYFFDFEFML